MLLRTLCPAKVNLGLRVIGKRPDGYHQLSTRFVQLALADVLEFQPGGNGLHLSVTGLPVPGPPAQNLVMRASEAYGRALGQPVSGTWRLHKRIPVAAGLGGGSSDAAGALRILWRASGCGLPAHELTQLARTLGADVPFFLLGGMAEGVERGDHVRALPWPGSWWVLLVFQEEGLSTGAVFREYDALLTAPPRPHSLGAGDLQSLRHGQGLVLENDLAPAAFRLMPKLADLLQRLQGMGLAGVGLSGSGPTLFGVAPQREPVVQAARILRAEGSLVRVTRFRRRVPRVVVVSA